MNNNVCTCLTLYFFSRLKINHSWPLEEYLIVLENGAVVNNTLTCLMGLNSFKATNSKMLSNSLFYCISDRVNTSPSLVFACSFPVNKYHYLTNQNLFSLFNTLISGWYPVMVGVTLDVFWLQLVTHCPHSNGKARNRKLLTWWNSYHPITARDFPTGIRGWQVELEAGKCGTSCHTGKKIIIKHLCS
jgi:hypothetical protein